jgi:hypothetical protein
MLKVTDFAKDYHDDRERAFKVLSSCNNFLQLKTARNYFEAVKQKWGYAQSINPTIKLMVDTDEEKFIKKLQSMEVSLIC